MTVFLSSFALDSDIGSVFYWSLFLGVSAFISGFFLGSVLLLSSGFVEESLPFLGVVVFGSASFFGSVSFFRSVFIFESVFEVGLFSLFSFLVFKFELTSDFLFPFTTLLPDSLFYS